MSFEDRFDWQDIQDIGPECNERFLDRERTPELESLDITLCGFSHLEGTYSVGRTDPVAHTILYSVDGAIELYTHEGRQTVEKSRLIILPAHRPFLITLEKPFWTMVWFDLLDGPRWRDSCINRRSVEYCDKGRQIFHALALMYYEKDESQRQPTVAYLDQRLKQTMQATSGESQEVQRLNQLFRDVQKKLHYPWTVEDMCNLIHYSAPHLHRLCQKHYDRSPLQQVIHLRMDRARHLLASTAWPIAQVAERVGYHDLFSFSKRFKKSIGVSPAKYRKNEAAKLAVND